MCVYPDTYSKKNKLTSLSDSNNSRAISLSSLFGKTMDTFIINKQCHVFTVFNDILVAYNANHYTVQCVSASKEIISHYNLNRSPVYMCVLDAPKAFDMVNLLLLFNKLRLKGM